MRSASLSRSTAICRLSIERVRRRWYLSKYATGFMLGGFLGGAEDFLLLSPFYSELLPPLENVDLLDWQACDQAIETGYRHAVEKLEQLRKPVVPAELQRE
jgi:hypothetical protein